jgi:hypothetical protein
MRPMTRHPIIALHGPVLQVRCTSGDGQGGTGLSGLHIPLQARGPAWRVLRTAGAHAGIRSRTHRRAVEFAMRTVGVAILADFEWTGCSWRWSSTRWQRQCETRVKQQGGSSQ